MMEEKTKDPFVEKIKEHLDGSCEQLDDTVLTRLRRARQEALHQAVSPWWRRFRLPAAAVLATAGAALAVTLLLHPQQPSEMAHLHSYLDDIELITSEESPDFYEELDFYLWLAEEQDSAA